MATLNVRAIETQKADETGDADTRKPSMWFVTASDGPAPMGHWNLVDCTQDSVLAAATAQHGAHYAEIAVELFPLP
jgi:hypothetical protein